MKRIDTDLIGPFLKEGKLSQEQMIDMLRRVYDKVRPHLDKFTLKPLGDGLACVHKDSMFYSSVGSHNPRSVGAIPLETQGICYFNDTGCYVGEVGKTRFQPAWGLTRQGDWVTINVEIGLAEYKPNEVYREYAVAVDISPAFSLERMLEFADVSALAVIRCIEFSVNDWMIKRRQLYEQAAELHEKIGLCQALLMTKI